MVSLRGVRGFLLYFVTRRCVVIPILSLQPGEPPHLSRQRLLIQRICNHPPRAGAKGRLTQI